MHRTMAVALATLFFVGCSGAPPPQSASCQAYAACVAARDAARGTTTNVDRFLADGACWGTAEGAAACDGACTRGLVVLRSFADAPSECLP
jgi:hypothetical protein